MDDSFLIDGFTITTILDINSMYNLQPSPIWFLYGETLELKMRKQIKFTTKAIVMSCAV